MDFNFMKTNRLSVFEMMLNLDWNALKTLLDGWKDGQAGVLSIKKKRKPKSPQQLGWYYAKPVGESKGGILQHAVDAFRKNEDYSLSIEVGDKKIEVELTRDNMDNFLKLRYAAMTGFYMDKADMSMAECSAFEDWCVKWLATWLKVQVPPPDPNWAERK